MDPAGFRSHWVREWHPYFPVALSAQFKSDLKMPSLKAMSQAGASVYCTSHAAAGCASTYLRKLNSIAGEAAWACLGTICDSLYTRLRFKICWVRKGSCRKKHEGGEKALLRARSVWLSGKGGVQSPLRSGLDGSTVLGHLGTTSAKWRQFHEWMGGCGHSFLILLPTPQPHNIIEKSPSKALSGLYAKHAWALLLQLPCLSLPAPCQAPPNSCWKPLNPHLPSPQLIHMSSQCIL